MTTEVLEEADNAATDLLRLYEALDVPAVVLTLVDGVVVARCQGAADVLWFCRKDAGAKDGPTITEGEPVAGPEEQPESRSGPGGG